MIDRSEFEAAGLLGPDSDPGRLEMLEWLDELGFTVDAMVAADGQKGLRSMASDRRLFGEPTLSREQASIISGVPEHRQRVISVALGFSASTGESEAGFGLTEAEARMVGLLSAASGTFSDEEGLGFIRVLGSAMGRVADAAIATFLTDVEGPHLEADGNELELAHKLFEAVGLVDELVTVFDPLLRRQMMQSIERSRLTAIDDVERLRHRYAVGFVDLVGFTPISHGMSSRDLSVFIRTFEGRAQEAVTSHGGRVVKLIGDEVMFVAPNPNLACAAAQALLEAIDTVDERSLLPRAGLAYGEVLGRGGDYYGDVVNLASRLVDEAVPQELLVTEAFASAADQIEFEPAGRRMLKGFEQPVVVLSSLLDS